MIYDKSKHDIGVLRQDGVTKVGFMLVKKNNQPAYGVFDDEYLAQQFFTGTPGYGSLPAEKEIAMRQDDWRSGFGLNVYDAADPKRYFSSHGMDLRFRGMAIPGPKPTAVTLPAYVSLAANFVNLGFELDSDWTTGLRSSDRSHGGTYSWKVFPTQTAYQLAKNWTTEFQSNIFTGGMWLWSREANTSRIYISEGTANATFSTNHVGDSTWKYLSVTHLVSANANNLRLTFQYMGGTNAYMDDCEFGSPIRGRIQAHAEYNDELLIGCGGVLANVSGSTLGHIHSSASNITALEVHPDDNLYIACNTNNFCRYMDLSYKASAVNEKFDLLETVHTANPTLWASIDHFRIKSAAEPSNSLAWSTPTNVDSSYHNITDLLSRAGALYIMKEDKPYYLDSVGAVQSDLAPKLEALTKSTSGKGAYTDGEKIWIPAGEQALLEVASDGTLTWRNPSDFCTNLPEFNGRVCAVTADDRYLFIVVDNGDVVYVFAGREETIDGSTSWVWHPIAEVPISGCETAFVSSIPDKRLWLSSTNTSEPLYYIKLTGYGDVLTDANRSFATNVDFETAYLHGAFKDSKKAFPELSVLLGHAYNTNRFYSAYYKTLTNTTYSLIANYTGSASSMYQTNYLPLSPSDYMARLKFVVNTDDTNEAPILLNYKLKGLLYPERRAIIACSLKCANRIPLKDGTVDDSYDDAVATLDEMLTATWPITLYDIDGNTKYVKPLPQSGPRWTALRDERGRETERQYNLLLMEIDLG